jgi:branched-chain amino acid transport system substrate-binding protein
MKTPPPIVFILLGLLAFFGTPRIAAFISSPDTINSELTQQPKHLNHRFSLGEKLLIPANATTEKKQGIEAFQAKNYTQAITSFQKSLTKFPNDPETRIYLNNAQVANQQPIKIAAVVPIGSNLDVAQEMLRGIAQAQEEFNTKGGNLQVQIVNDENNSELAQQIAKVLIKDSSILAVIGSNASNASLAAAPIYQQGGLVMITPTSTSDELSNFGSYIFRTAPTNNDMANTLAEYAVKTAKRKNVAICYDSQAVDNVTFKDAFIPALVAQGGNFINTECDLAAPDFNGEIAVNNLISSGAEAVLLAPHIDKLNRAIDLARANQWKMILLGTFSLNTSKITQSGQGDLNGVVLPAPFHPQQESAQNFTNQASKLWGEDTMLTWRTATSYDAATAIATSLKQYPTRDGLQSALRTASVAVMGANSQVQFLPSGDRIIKSTLVKVKATPQKGYYFELLASE